MKKPEKLFDPLQIALGNKVSEKKSTKKSHGSQLRKARWMIS